MTFTPRRRRMMWVALLVSGAAVAVFLILAAFQKNLLYFYTPSQIATGAAPHGYAFRVGGMVEQGSLQRAADGLTVGFTLTDGAQQVRVNYKGILPDLFREGQGIIAIGKLGESGDFVASEVLAKHDENYMPPEVAASMQAGALRPTEFARDQP